MQNDLTRRAFLGSAAALTAGLALGAAPARRGKIKLGYDNFAIRSLGWKAAKHLDHAASLKLDTMYLTDLDVYESTTDEALKELRKKAQDLGLEIHAGTGGVCISSTAWKDKWGTPEEHLKTTIRVSKALGSPVARVYLGRQEDRGLNGGIERHMMELVKLFKSVKSYAVDAGVKIAVENHAGDMQAWELAGLIEEAGKDYVGAAIDSGNAVWAQEDPLSNLEILAPYIVTSSLRDSAAWLTDDGNVVVQWTAMGDGQVDWKAYVEKWAAVCPNVPIQLELISGFNRTFPIQKPEFQKLWPKAREADREKFMAFVKKGKPRDAWKPPAGVDRKVAEQEFQKSDLEKSVKFCRETLGLGTKA